MSLRQHAAAGSLVVPAGSAAGLRDRWLALRDRLLMSPRFQRLAARLPLTRAIANRRALALFDIAAGFVYAQVLKACLDLELLEHLAGGPLARERLVEATGLSGEALERLLHAAQSLGLLQQRSGACWGLGAQGAALLGNPAIAAMVRHHTLLYADLADPVALLKDRSQTRLAAYWGYAASERPAALSGEQVQAYSRLMAASQALIADDILDHYPLRRHRTMLDVAGGEGVFAVHAARRWPHLQVGLLDLPAVAERARLQLAGSGLDDRVQVHAGDFSALERFSGLDLVSLVRVLHDHDDPKVLWLLKAARRALRPGGSLLIAEPMAGTRGAERIGDVYFGVYLWAMGSGRARRREELYALLRAAGFAACREVRTARPLLVRMLVAQA